MKKCLVLSLMVFMLILFVSAAGVFYRTSGSPFRYATVRGETVVFQGNGLYRYDPAWFAREGIVWDAVNLFIGLPLLAAAIYLTFRGSLRGRLLLEGLCFTSRTFT